MELTAMRPYHMIRRARIVTIAAAFTAIAVSVFAQNGQSQFSISLQNAAAQPQTGAVRRVSIDEAVALALEQNLGIRIQRLDPQIQDIGIVTAKSFWAPSLTTGFSRQSQTQQPTSAFSGSSTNIKNGNFAGQAAVSQTLPWGGSYAANWNSVRSTPTNLATTFSPQLNSTVHMQFSPPLLRNFAI